MMCAFDGIIIAEKGRCETNWNMSKSDRNGEKRGLFFREVIH